MPKLKNEPPRLETWDDVRFFLAIHRAGSLSAAAGPLGVTQPTCGRRLAALEASLGLTLFDRTPSGLRLTTEGGSLLEAASAMEQSADAFSLRAAIKDRDLEGVVRVAASEAFAVTFLVGAVQKLREKYPGIQVELVLSNTEADLLKREADIAFRFRPEGMRPAPEVLFAQKLGDEPHLLYGATAYLQKRGVPPAADALAGHDVCVFAGRHPAAEWCATAYREASIAVTAPSLEVVAHAVAAGIGLGVLPRRAARRFPELRAVSPIVARGTGWLIVHPSLRKTPRVRVVVDLFAGLFRADPAS